MFHLNRFDKNIDNDFISSLEDGWDWALSDASSLVDFVKHVYDSGEANISYWVSLGSTPVGLIEFSQYSEKDFKKAVDIGLFIHKDYRGIGIADMLVQSSVFVLKELGLPTVATVSVDNSRSLGLMRKAVGVQGELMFEPKRERDAYVFDFDKITVAPLLADKFVIASLLADGNLIKKMFSNFN